MPRSRTLAALTGLALTAGSLGVVTLGTAPAQADVSTTIAAFPYSQPWSDAGLITANDNWSGVPGVQGYLGTDPAVSPGADPQTVTSDGSAITDVIANGASTSTAGGVLEAAAEQTIALQGSGTADAPHVVFRLDLTGQTGMTFSFDARDIDGSADNAIQQIAVQYRVGSSGAYTNLPAGYIADATTGGTATQVTERDVDLPAATDGQADVFVRVITADAAGSDEWVGIDDITIAAGGSGPAEPQADCGDGPLLVDTDESGSRDVSAVDADSQIVAAEITSDDVAGITLDDFTASTADGGPGTATLNVADTTADGTYEVEIEFATDDDPAQTGTCSVTVVVSDQDAVTPISVIQGDSDASDMVGSLVNVEAVVTSVITASDVTDGFFLQEEDADADDDPATSEGIYVFCRNDCPENLAAGDRYRVSGEVDEFNTTTQVAAAFGDGSFELLEPGATLPTAAVVELPADASTEAETTFEAVEGMRTTISTTLAVSEYFNQARFGEIVLTAEERPYQFTQTDEPSVDGYTAHLADLATRQIILDDNSNSQNAATTGPEDNEPYYYPTPGLSTGNFFRGGDTIDDLTGVFEYSFGAWKLRPVAGADYTFEATNPRPASPSDVGGRLTVASFNVLNYFATIDETSSNNTGPCGPDGTQDCRGADSEAERQRQLDKIVAALGEIDADVFGLIEIQNDEGDATVQIVDALNAATAPGTYDYIDTGFIGTDAIKQAFVYKTGTVTPVGDFDLLTAADDPRFDDDGNRPALIQTFEEISTGERVTVAVNHLKSKGSACGTGDDSPADGSGNCDVTRTSAAQALADHLATDPTGSGDSDALIIGDLNSYAMERPIAALLDAGYTDLLQQFEGPDAYTYLFDGQLGTLDYGLANASLAEQVTGASGWAINADENPLFDYNDTVLDAGEASFERESTALPLYEATPYRASDHDPVIIGLALGEEEKVTPRMRVERTPKKVYVNRTRVKLDVSVRAAGDPIDGEVRVRGGRYDKTKSLENGEATFRLPKYKRPGVKTVTVVFKGTDTAKRVVREITFRVRRNR